MLITNGIFSDFVKGGSKSDVFESVVDRNLSKLHSVDICVGFCGADVLKKYAPKFKKIAKNGQRVRLIFGMYSQAGSFPKTLYNELMDLHSFFEKTESGSAVLISTEAYHGKIYDFGSEVWIGSSNFSRTGLRDQHEATVQIQDETTVNEIRQYISELSDPKKYRTVPINMVVLDAPESSVHLNDLKKYSSLPRWLVPDDIIFKLPLRVEVQPQSGLNLSRGKGRISKGKYTPRPWYEVEISSDSKARSQEGYPKTPNATPQKTHTKQKENIQCEFTALLYDGFVYRVCPMQTYSDYNKAMGSTPRTLLGEYIKGQLEKAKLLRAPMAITPEILNAYGRDAIEVTRYTDIRKDDNGDLRNKVYVFDFTSPEIGGVGFPPN